MKKTLILFLAAAAVLTGCTKTAKSGPNDAAKRYFDSWIHINHPDARRTPLGVYVLDGKTGTGELCGDCDNYPFVRLEYTVRNLDGTITETTRETVAKQLGTYDPTYYYGPDVTYRGNNSLYVGVEEVLDTMRVGGSTTIVIPGWLVTNKQFATEDEYLANVTGDSQIYEFTVTECIKDIKKWETDSIARYLAANFPEVNPADTVSSGDDDFKKYGFYFIRTGEPTSEKKMPSDTTFHINYTGRLLNGRVFDTTIKDTAKVYGLYTAGKKYEPVLINMAEEYTGVTMSSDETKVIDGFAYALYQMHPYEKCTCIFYSGIGYGYSGSGNAIPAYSPLRFDLEIVDEN